jgi:hypothetical protein
VNVSAVAEAQTIKARGPFDLTPLTGGAPPFPQRGGASGQSSMTGTRAMASATFSAG